MKSHLRIILLVSAWLMMSAVLKSKVEAQTVTTFVGSGSGDGDMSDMLMPEETVSMTTSIMQISATNSSTLDPITIEARVTSVSSSPTAAMPISPATNSRVILPATIAISSSSATVNQSVTTLQILPTLTSAPATMPPMDSSSIPTTEIETTTNSSLESLTIFTSASVTPTPTILFTSVSASMPLPTTEPTTTMGRMTPVPTTEVVETSTTEQTTAPTGDVSTTGGEGDSTTTMSTSAVDPAIAQKPLSTVEIIIIIIAVVVFLIIVFVIASCVLAGLLCKRYKKEDPVKREILSNWELQEPPKHGGARLMKIRTLDGMEEIGDENGIEGSDRDQREPRGVVSRNIRETSDGGNNTAFTFGVHIVVDKTVGKGGETPQTVPDGRQNGRSEALDDRGVQNEIKESVSGLKENKASFVTEAPPTTKPLKTNANDESEAAAFKEMDKPFQDTFHSGHKSELEQQNFLLAKKDVERVFGAQGLFQDFQEVSTQL